MSTDPIFAKKVATYSSTLFRVFIRLFIFSHHFLSDGFNQTIIAPLLDDHNLVTGCKFHSIDLVMKKDHIVYGKADTTRSQDALVLVN